MKALSRSALPLVIAAVAAVLLMVPFAVSAAPMPLRPNDTC